MTSYRFIVVKDLRNNDSLYMGSFFLIGECEHFKKNGSLSMAIDLLFLLLRIFDLLRTLCSTLSLIIFPYDYLDTYYYDLHEMHIFGHKQRTCKFKVFIQDASDCYIEHYYATVMNTRRKYLTPAPTKHF